MQSAMQKDTEHAWYIVLSTVHNDAVQEWHKIKSLFTVTEMQKSMNKHCTVAVPLKLSFSV